MAGGIREQRRAFWRGAVQDWARSGLSKAAYAREHGLAAYQLGQWASRYPEWLSIDEIAFVTDAASIQVIRLHIGEPTRPPRPAPARDPPAWASAIDGGEAMDLPADTAAIDPLAQPEPESMFDQGITW